MIYTDPYKKNSKAALAKKVGSILQCLSWAQDGEEKTLTFLAPFKMNWSRNPRDMTSESVVVL